MATARVVARSLREGVRAGPWLWLVLWAGLSACDEPSKTPAGSAGTDDCTAPVAYFADADGDGFGSAETSVEACAPPSGHVDNADDCDDTDAAVHPTADEVCDGVDNDCDTLVDAVDDDLTDPVTVYADTDADGFGDATAARLACGPESGWVTDATDCDDTLATTAPGAAELESTTDCMADADLDGWGDADATGAVVAGSDCDDSDPGLSPDAQEVCDGLDNDCDGLVDDADDSVDLTFLLTFYADADYDGYGDPDVTIEACSVPAGYVDDASDCDDSQITVHPGSAEVCDGQFNDCLDPLYVSQAAPDDELDLDADGFVPCVYDPETWVGDPGVSAGYDCDDGASTVFPGADEVCDGQFNDCDDPLYGTQAAPDDELDDDADHYVDCAHDPTTWAGDPTVLGGADCDDTDDTVHPTASELCDGQFNDCDDPLRGTQAAPSSELDDDADAFVECTHAAATWVGSGAVTGGDDCDDTDATVYPGAAEDCDGRFTDCDDPLYGVQAAPSAELDIDSDTFIACTYDATTWVGSSAVVGGDDCDDTDSTVFPAASEVCDGQFNDCDDPLYGTQAAPDDELDDDADGFVECAHDSATWAGDPAVVGGADCDDGDSGVSPASQEVCDSGDVDEDCDGLADDDDPTVDPTTESTFFADTDSDGFGAALVSVDACDAPSGYVVDSSDCDDTDATVHPSATEVCDGQFNDCTDPLLGVQAAPSNELDDDGDTFVECAYDSSTWVGSGAVVRGEDCDDTDGTVFPAATEVCDGQFNDCDAVLYGTQDAPDDELDDDADGYVDCSHDAATWAGDAAVVGGDDCDDTDAGVSPGEVEVCDALDVDEDCDGVADDDDPSVDATTLTTFYADDDDDGYGSSLQALDACDPPAGYIVDDTDCDDEDDTVYPSATEVCDGQFNDCDAVLYGTQDAPDDELDDDADGYVDCAHASGTWAGDPTVVGGEDCDDTDATVAPAATEVCDGQFNDCDDVLYGTQAAPDDELDDDADGFVDCTYDSATWAGSTAVLGGSDCDDTDSGVHPAATEVCDVRDTDEDCDGLVDDDDPSVSAASKTDFYADADADTYGDATVHLQLCAQPSGYVLDSADCDDTDDTVHPRATEVCDGQFNDCTDPLLGVQAAPDSELDDDGDTYVECTHDSSTWVGSGAVIGGEDCDDTDASAYPAADEVCDGQFNDCDDPLYGSQAAPDDELDNDSDGYVECSYDSGTWVGDAGVTAGDDCDDAEPGVNPGATEVCDASDVDEDCDGLADDDDSSVDPATQTRFHDDVDADSYGDAAVSQLACSQPSGTVTDSDDCDDTDSTVHPAASEVCDGQFNDCDDPLYGSQAAPDDELDNDGDGYVECTYDGSTWAGSSGVTGGDDCDDVAATVYPTADEACDGQFNDCDAPLYGTQAAPDDELDNDGDGYVECAYDAATWVGDAGVTAGEDCDDAAAGTHPGATEVCDAADTDEDCDGLADDDDPSVDAGTRTTAYLDADGDGYGDPSDVEVVCDLSTGYIVTADDCDDTDASVYPGASERCDGQTNDCDDPDYATQVAPADELDDDADGYVECTYDFASWAGSSGVTGGDDCDDTDGTVYPTADEACDGQFNDCDDPLYGTQAAPDDELDNDGDGYVECSYDAPTWVGSTGVSAGDDCDDADATTHPGGIDDVDGADNDCVGDTDAIDLAGADAIVQAVAAGDALSGAASAAGWPAYSLAAAGDIDGDGLDDVFLGAPGSDANVTDGGAAYLFLGPLSGTLDASTADARWSGVSTAEGAGRAVMGVGDVDGDSFPDLAIGAPDNADSATGSGTAYLFFGPATGGMDVDVADVVVDAGVSDAFLGTAFGRDGDLDGDGIVDFVVGAPAADHGATDAGAAYIFAGSSTGGLSGSYAYTDADVIFEGHGADDWMGTTIASGADLDGDGHDDLVLGAPGESAGKGAVYTWMGPISAGTYRATTSTFGMKSTVGGEFGTALATGDLNGDGTLDLVVGAREDGSNAPLAGAVFVFHGPMAGPRDRTQTIANATLRGGESGDGAGAVDVVGDLDGDGTLDLLIGAPGADSARGETYVVTGPISGTLELGASGLASSPGHGGALMFLGETAGDGAGTTVAGVGDTDGDGLDDVLIGAPGQDTTGSEAGAAYLVQGLSWP